MWTNLPMLNEASAATVVAAAAPGGVEGLKRLGINLAQREATEEGPDVLLDLGDVALARRHIDVEHAYPPVKELADGGTGARIAPLVDLGQEAGSGSLRLALSLGAGRDGLSQVVTLLRHGIDPGVDLHAE
jgi:hypothetical protein